MKMFVSIAALVLLLSACQMWGQPDKEEGSYQEQVKSAFNDKKVVMVILDSMMGSSLDQSIEEGDLPGLQFLIENGQYEKELVASFPSMSVTIESTLITGEMADQHRVPGLSWFDLAEDRIVNYGLNWQFWIKNSLTQGIYDVFYRLNNEHLSPKVNTIFEELEQQKLTSGAINMLLYRGDHKHQLTLPAFTNEITHVPQTIETQGPNVLAFGRFTKPEVIWADDFSDDMFNRFGLQDEYSMEITKELIGQDDQPDFLLIFLPDNDKETHVHSPHYRQGLIRADEYLQDMLSAYESWEKALDENIFIVLGDHGQDKLVMDESNLAINLEALYADFAISPLGEPVSNGEISFGVNQRMAYVYDVHDQGLLPTLADWALHEMRIDLAAWSEGEWVTVVSPDHGGVLRFKPGGEWTDRYDQKWSIEGNEDILTLITEPKQKRVAYVDYPDALLHLKTALDSHEASKIILAAKPGHSFLTEGVTLHPDGGEHGGLHKNDILAAMVIAGTEQEPKFLRIVDLKDYVLQLLTTNSEPKTIEK